MAVCSGRNRLAPLFGALVVLGQVQLVVEQQRGSRSDLAYPTRFSTIPLDSGSAPSQKSGRNR